MIIVAADGELPPGEGQGREGKRAASNCSLTFDTYIAKTCAAPDLVKMCKETIRRPVHRVFEQNGRGTVEVVFAYSLVPLNLSNI